MTAATEYSPCASLPPPPAAAMSRQTEKRFSDFVALRDELCHMKSSPELADRVAGLKALPPKAWLSNTFTAKFVEERRKRVCHPFYARAQPRHSRRAARPGQKVPDYACVRACVRAAAGVFARCGEASGGSVPRAAATIFGAARGGDHGFFVGGGGRWTGATEGRYSQTRPRGADDERSHQGACCLCRHVCLRGCCSE
eukprot:COSAG01_NODE_3426_length_6110_cov_20.537015_3_plen_198_part_00